MTGERNGDAEPDEFPRKRMRQPCAVSNSHTWEAGADPWQTARGKLAVKLAVPLVLSAWTFLFFQFHGACYSGTQYVIIGVIHGCRFPTQVSLDSPDAQERVLTSATSSGSHLMLVLTPKLCKNGECSQLSGADCGSALLACVLPDSRSGC